MKSIESSAKTIEDAIRQGLEKIRCFPLATSTIDIIQESTKKFFGLVGGKEAIVRLTVKESAKEVDILSTLSCNVSCKKRNRRQAKTKKSNGRKPAQKNVQPKAAVPVKKNQLLPLQWRRLFPKRRSP